MKRGCACLHQIIAPRVAPRSPRPASTCDMSTGNHPINDGYHPCCAGGPSIPGPGQFVYDFGQNMAGG